MSRRSLPIVCLALLSACAPKPRIGAAATPTATAAPTPIAWAEDARKMLARGLFSGEVGWNDPPIATGERVTWHITTEPLSEPRQVTVARAGDHWTLTSNGHSLEVTLSADRSAITSAAWSPPDGPPVLLERPEEIASLYAAPQMMSEGSVAASGGIVHGNEVVRVPAGDFRARHAILSADGRTTHLYLVRGVPGGVVKIERFEGASDAPAMVMELEGFTRVKAPQAEP